MLSIKEKAARAANYYNEIYRKRNNLKYYDLLYGKEKDITKNKYYKHLQKLVSFHEEMGCTCKEFLQAQFEQLKTHKRYPKLWITDVVNKDSISRYRQWKHVQNALDAIPEEVSRHDPDCDLAFFLRKGYPFDEAWTLHSTICSRKNSEDSKNATRREFSGTS